MDRITRFLFRWFFWLPILVMRELFSDDSRKRLGKYVLVVAFVAIIAPLIVAIGVSVPVSTSAIHVVLAGFAIYLWEGIIVHHIVWDDGFL